MASPISSTFRGQSSRLSILTKACIDLGQQTLVQNTVDAVYEAKFPAALQQRYLTAARNLRLPYYDWAQNAPSGQSSLPEILIQPQVQVMLANGTQMIDNPLYSYRFKDTEPLYWFPFVIWQNTLRWPTSNSSADAQSQEDKVRQYMDSFQAQARDTLYILLTQYNTFNNFSNEAWQRENNVQGYASIEGLHDNVHSAVGGQNWGHMSVIDSCNSLFQQLTPSSNIDRAYALWQTLHPDSFVEPAKQMYPTFSTRAGETLDSKSPLKPFHSDASGTFWTSDSARDFKTFSYTYPELLGSNNQSVNLSTLRTTINNLYGKKATGVNLRARDVVRRSLDLGGRATDNPPRDYLLNMRVAKNGLADSFLIYFFLGDFSPDPAAWTTDENMIGTKAVLSMKAPGQTEPVDITGSVPLTAVLEERVERGELPGMEVPQVTQFLRGKLHWRVRNVSFFFFS
ncbi:hypothetical protein LTS18_005385 [Coniosporium uncinatum]|uniref:Uncharacterized protein n=1 Tax=Coniosporium uncinatum TaxID=93489 RepID=A0ACC3D4N5_9PEZI|nr:hypothetical protein LTS18_005385 [Coniosporium uncinatum]